MSLLGEWSKSRRAGEEVETQVQFLMIQSEGAGGRDGTNAGTKGGKTKLDSWRKKGLGASFDPALPGKAKGGQRGEERGLLQVIWGVECKMRGVRGTTNWDD